MNLSHHDLYPLRVNAKKEEEEACAYVCAFVIGGVGVAQGYMQEEQWQCALVVGGWKDLISSLIVFVGPKKNLYSSAQTIVFVVAMEITEDNLISAYPKVCFGASGDIGGHFSPKVVLR